MNLDVEDNRIIIDVGIITDVTVKKSERVRYVKDVYSTEYKTECKYTPIKIYDRGAPMSVNFTLSDSASLSDVGIGAECSVIDCSGIAEMSDVSYDDDGRMTATGKAKFTLLMDKNGEYCCSDVELPFRYSADVGVKGERTVNDLCPSVISCRARIDGERVGIDAEISLCGTLGEMTEISVLDSVSFGDEIVKDRGQFVICYPTSDDSLWSIAKRYGTTVSEIIKNNRISTDAQYDTKESLGGMKYLIV